MTQFVTIDRATLEQLVVALEGIEALIEHQYTGTREGMNALQNASDDAQVALNKLRAALANAETAGWQTLVDQGKEAHELAKIMKDFADKNPESLMLKELDN